MVIGSRTFKWDHWWLSRCLAGHRVSILLPWIRSRLFLQD